MVVRIFPASRGKSRSTRLLQERVPVVAGTYGNLPVSQEMRPLFDVTQEVVVHEFSRIASLSSDRRAAPLAARRLHFGLHFGAPLSPGNGRGAPYFGDDSARPVLVAVDRTLGYPSNVVVGVLGRRLGRGPGGGAGPPGRRRA